MPPRPNVRELGLKLTYMEKTSKEDDESLPVVTDIPQQCIIRKPLINKSEDGASLISRRVFFPSPFFPPPPQKNKEENANKTPKQGGSPQLGQLLSCSKRLDGLVKIPYRLCHRRRREVRKKGDKTELSFHKKKTKRRKQARKKNSYCER